MADALHVAGVVSAQEARLNDGGLLAVQGPAALDVRTGVMCAPGAEALVTGTSDTAPMAVNVAAHHWATSRGSASGPYRGTKEASTKVTIAAAPGSGTRIDVVYEKMQDATPGLTPAPDASTGELYAVLQGTVGAGKPNLAAIAGAEELATVAVSAGATATNGAGVVITNTARLTAARGGLVVVRSDAERDAISGYAGLQLLELHTGRRRYWDGARLRYDGDYVTVANLAGRNALTPYAGLQVHQSDTGVTWVRTQGGAWVTVGGDTGWANLPLNNSFFAVASTRYRVKGGICYAHGFVRRAAAWAAGTVWGTLPAGARPPVDWSETLQQGDGVFSSGIIFAATGGITVQKAFGGSNGEFVFSFEFPVD